MSTSNIEYLDSKVQQMNLATFSEEQISFQLDKSRVIELESENNTLKLQLKTKEQSWNKDRAILTQKIELLESHIYESKIRQENLQKMNEAFMTTLNDLTANPKNFSNKMLKDLQQLFENRLLMDPDAESKLQKSTLTIKQQQEEIEELKKVVAQQEQEIQLLKRKLQDNETVIENSLQRQQQDLALITQEKQKECKTLEKENIKMKQQYEKEILALQKKNSNALSQIAQLQQGNNFENSEQCNEEITRLNNIIDAMSQNHKLEIDLMRQQTQNELKMMENKIRVQENNQIQTQDQESSAFIQKIQTLENEKNILNNQLQNVISQLNQVSDQNSGITTALQHKESQIEELKNKVAQMQTSMPLTCQDFFDVELQISRIEPERSKRRSIVNESLISNMTPINNNRESNNPPSLNMIGGSIGFNGQSSENGLSNNTSSNNFPQNNQNIYQPNPNNTNNNTFSNTTSNNVFQTPNLGNQIPLLQNNYGSNQSQNQSMVNQGFGLAQSIQFNSSNGNQERKLESQKSLYSQHNQFMRQGSLANSELSNCDTFGNPSAVKNKRVISASASTNNLANEFLHQNGFQIVEINGQTFLKTDQSSQSQQSSNQQKQLTMDTSIEKKSSKAGLIVQKRKLQSSENMESQTSIHNLKTDDTVTRRERTTTTSGSYHSGGINNSLSCTNIIQLKNNGTTPFHQNGNLHQEIANKALNYQQIQQQKMQKNQNLRNNSLNPNKLGGSAYDTDYQNQNVKQHIKNQSLSNNNIPLAVQDLKKSMTDSQNNVNNTNNNINSSVSYNNINHYNSNQSIISQGNILGASQSFIKNNPMSQSSLLNQEQSFLVRAIQENMQERLTLEEKMKNLETEVQNYVMINQQKSKGPISSSFSQLVQQVMKELYTKQLNKSIFLLSKEERENVLKQEIKSLVDKVMVKPLQQRQQSQENKSIIINQSLNKSISIEDGILKETKSPRYHQISGNLGVSNILNSSSLSSSKGFLNFVNQNKENSSFNPKQTGSLKSNSNLLSRIQVKPNSSTSFSSQLQGLQGQNFFDKKIGQLNLNLNPNRNSRQIN